MPRRIQRFAFFAVIAIAAVGSPHAVLAICRQYSPPVPTNAELDERFTHAKVIFLGTIVRQIGSSVGEKDVQHEVDVTKVWKGRVHLTVVVNESRPDYFCDNPYATGDQLLIFGTPAPDGSFAIPSKSTCSARNTMYDPTKFLRTKPSHGPD